MSDGIRSEVWEFAQAMEEKLKKNDHKTHWRELPIEALRRLMLLEVQEFEVAREFFGKAETANELVDIANFAMMLRDRILTEPTPRCIENIVREYFK
jgi:hypothetical protein